MAETATKLPVKNESPAAPPAASSKHLRPFESLRRELDRVMDDFGRGMLTSPFHRNLFSFDRIWPRDLEIELSSPAVDIVEKDNAFEIVAELPGLDEKNVEVSIANGGLTIKGEKQEEREEKKKDYHLHERSFGSFERTFGIPEGVDRSKIDAVFKKGVLTITLPKTVEAKQSEKKITIKAA